MGKIKDFFVAHKLKILGLTGAISCTISFVLTIFCYIFGVFVEGDSSITVFESIEKMFAITSQFSLPIAIEALFGLVHVSCLVSIGFHAVPYVLRSMKFVVMLLAKNDEKLADDMTFLRERALSVFVNLGVIITFGTVLSNFELSTFAIVCVAVTIVAFALSTVCLMFVAREDIPLASHIATESVRYTLTPVVMCIMFVFAIPSNALSSIFFKVFNIVASIDAIIASTETMTIIKTLYYIIFEGGCVVATVILFLVLVSNFFDNITPNSRTYLYDKISSKNLFLILGIISASRCVLRFVAYNLFIDGAITSSFEQMLKHWFVSVRNDVLPLTLICFVGYCLLFSKFERIEKKQEADPNTPPDYLGNSFFTSLTPGQM